MIYFWDIVPTLQNSLFDSRSCYLNRGRPEEKYRYFVTSFLEIANDVPITAAREGSFKAKIDSLPGEIFYLFEHYSARANSSRLRSKGRHPLSNEVSIEKVPAISVLGQELAGEGSLPNAIGPGHNVDIRIQVFKKRTLLPWANCKQWLAVFHWLAIGHESLHQFAGNV